MRGRLSRRGMVRDRPTLLFISPRFLLPMDAGGKIRTANLLKRLKGGAFKTRLLMPATAKERAEWGAEVPSLADEVDFFAPSPRNALWKLRRAFGLLTGTPISAFADADARFKRAVKGSLRSAPDLVVFDYVQSLAAAPAKIDGRRLFLAHNVEAEILERHAKTASGLMKFVWSREAAKMRAFEVGACARTDGVIAVSERDAEIFRREFGAHAALAIPTGVDPDFFAFAPPASDAAPVLVFIGSMDWKANQDGLFWMMDEVWPLIAAKRADASLAVIGKNPPASMLARAKKLNWRFTGFVDDVREHAKGAAFVIPLRVGGGTRIKAYEAMAMGLPVVSTTLGVEGLPVADEEHLLIADGAPAFAEAALRLLDDAALRVRLAKSARSFVEKNFTHDAAARAFERHCLEVLDRAR